MGSEHVMEHCLSRVATDLANVALMGVQVSFRLPGLSDRRRTDDADGDGAFHHSRRPESQTVSLHHETRRRAMLVKYRQLVHSCEYLGSWLRCPHDCRCMGQGTRAHADEVWIARRHDTCSGPCFKNPLRDATEWVQGHWHLDLGT